MPIENFSPIDSATVYWQLREITALLNDYFSSPFYSRPELWAIFVALVIAVSGPTVSEWFKRRYYKPSLEFSKMPLLHLQPLSGGNNTGQQLIWRLSLKNNGLVSAKNVEVHVEKIFDNDKERDNFLPGQLIWTHAQTKSEFLVVRDIHPGQTVSLDFCSARENSQDRGERTLNRSMRSKEAVTDNDSPINKIEFISKLQLAVAAGASIDDFSAINSGNTVVSITAYEESGNNCKALVEIEWSQEPRAINIQCKQSTA